jgi:putative PEP-CTERM system histidine kinase
MFTASLDLSLVGDLLALIVYSAFALHFSYRLLRQSGSANAVSYVFVAALASSAIWAGLGLAAVLHRPAWFVSLAMPLADQLRYGLWFGFVLLLLRPVGPNGGKFGEMGLLALLALISISASVLLLVLGTVSSAWSAALAPAAAFAALAKSVAGLILVEQLLRNVSADARWNAKPVCLGLGAIFAFDLFVYSQVALFRKFDGDALSVRTAVHSAAVPLLFLASQRHADWLDKLHVSRAVIFHSATLLLVGAYLLLISALGYYVRYTGGDWGRALQLALVFVALMALAVLVFSGTVRSRLKVYISKNFFSYRYDYREEWLRFTAILSTSASAHQMGETVVRALANLVESTSGSLWLCRAAATEFTQTARWNLPVIPDRVESESSFSIFLRDKAWIIDLDQVRLGDAKYTDLHTPSWLLSDIRYWLVVPLLVNQELTGFVLLGRARASIEINWEVRDLLKTASSQASSYLAQMRSTEALLESKKFDAFNRMSAFVVHDLKNIVTQLSLMMRNAKRLRDNPEFQQDMLDTVENSLEKMRQLMLQLREGDRPHGVTSGVDLELIAKRLVSAAAGKGRVLQLQLLSRVSTRGHDERVERVLGHVVQNAFDASDSDGIVYLQLDQSGSQALVKISDQGCGMSEDFIQTRLFKPFQSTKASGMGIGAYESYQYLQELGGQISVKSKPNLGTTVTILLPLFHAVSASDLSLTGAK